MEYVYATLLVAESDLEPNEQNLGEVLEAAGMDPSPSKLKSLVAALEDVNVAAILEDARTDERVGDESETPEPLVDDHPDVDHVGSETETGGNGRGGGS